MSDTKIFKVTKSDFINYILSCNNIIHGMRSSTAQDEIKKVKSLVSTNVDKWLWNDLVSDDKFETDFCPSNDAVFNCHVNLRGPSNTDYGEFIRAFNKLLYRFFNDGDRIWDGPYSALTYFLRKEIGSRYFCMDECLSGINISDCAECFKDCQNAYEESERISTNFSNLINVVAKGCSPECACLEHHDGLERWCNTFITLIDQLTDDIKGLKSCYESCDNYYKNTLEYSYNEIYQWLQENFNITNWSAQGTDRYCEDFSNEDKRCDIKCHSSYNFSIQFPLSKEIFSGFYFSKQYTIDTRIPIDDGILRILNYLLSINNIRRQPLVGEYIEIGCYANDRKYDVYEIADGKETALYRQINLSDIPPKSDFRLYDLWDYGSSYIKIKKSNKITDDQRKRFKEGPEEFATLLTILEELAEKANTKN